VAMARGLQRNIRAGCIRCPASRSIAGVIICDSRKVKLPMVCLFDFGPVYLVAN
jgi:hypothetical protein